MAIAWKCAIDEVCKLAWDCAIDQVCKLAWKRASLPGSVQLRRCASLPAGVQLISVQACLEFGTSMVNSVAFVLLPSW